MVRQNVRRPVWMKKETTGKGWNEKDISEYLSKYWIYLSTQILMGCTHKY